MSGNREGGILAARKVKENYGDDFFNYIGKLGGAKSRGGGFATDKVGADGLTGSERASLAGSKGGKISRRRKAQK